MIKILFLVFCFFGASFEGSICLNMIVKNEKEVIVRCLESVLPLIDTWVIIDTGSTDGTQEIIKTFLKDVPGTLYERPWVNFGYNRNEALSLAKNKADYILFMDADDTLLFSQEFKLPNLTSDFYACFAKGKGTTSLLPRLIKTNREWKWHGALHEYILADTEVQGAFLEGVTYLYHHDGARSQDPNSLKKDALILEAAILENPKESRNFFYLGKTYEALGRFEEAIQIFQKRSEMRGFPEEVFLSKLAIAQIQGKLEKESRVVCESFLKAFLERPHRLEAIYYLIETCLKEENYQKGFLLAKTALDLPRKSRDELFVEHWIYDFGLLFQYAICAMHTNHNKEGISACIKLLANLDLPSKDRDKIQSCFEEMQGRQIRQVQQDLQKMLFPQREAL